jgi:DNA mismatch endonuclease (patch repair protein)
MLTAIHGISGQCNGERRTLMPDLFPKNKRSQIMAAVRSRGNKETELKLISILRCAGIKGWRRHQAILGCPDFIFGRARLAVFVDGCFWHGCRRHCRMPRENREYWQRKISRKAKRDRTTNRLLRQAGLRGSRIWAHSLRVAKAAIGPIASELRAGWQLVQARELEIGLVTQLTI